mmetsp:Transcript_16212/g.35142  ORF Transcript_16212/g.35142 Transcript_16212/m.35142 type:complete len:81 (+) Transcript_16212:332-574(+)
MTEQRHFFFFKTSGAFCSFFTGVGFYSSCLCCSRGGSAILARVASRSRRALLMLGHRWSNVLVMRLMVAVVALLVFVRYG